MLINSVPAAQAAVQTNAQAATYNEIRDIGTLDDPGNATPESDTDTVTLSDRAVAISTLLAAATPTFGSSTSATDDDEMPMPAYKLLKAPPKKPPKPAPKLSLLDLIDYFRLMRPHMKAALLGQKLPAPDEVRAAKPPQGV